MGDYADDALRMHMQSGIAFDRDRPVRRRKLVACPDCGKECRGEAGVMEHQNAKHGTSFSWGDIDNIQPDYE